MQTCTFTLCSYIWVHLDSLLILVKCLPFQLIIERIQSINELIDASLMERIASSSLDFLITSAVATVDVSAVAVDIAPLLILCMCGFIWNLVMLGCLSTFLLPNHWYVRRKPITLVVLLCTISLSLVSYGQVGAQTPPSQSHTPSSLCVYEVFENEEFSFPLPKQ